MNSITMTDTACFGCECLGRLKRVMVHRPGDELKIINSENCHYWLFDSVPDINAFRDEHLAYTELLQSHGVEVLELSDHIENPAQKLDRMPNITYMHDIAVISSRGAIISCMAWDGRKNEHTIVKEALQNIGIPIFFEFDEPDDAFEGCLLLSPKTVLVAETERHNLKSINKFIAKALSVFDEIIYIKIPKARRYMHPDTIYNRITERLSLVYLSAFESTFLYTRKNVKKIDFSQFMQAKGIELVDVSDSEQRRLACSFVPLEPGVIFHYDTALDDSTRKLLTRKKVEMILFHPEALVAGGGSLRCITLRLHRTAT